VCKNVRAFHSGADSSARRSSAVKATRSTPSAFDSVSPFAMLPVTCHFTRSESSHANSAVMHCMIWFTVQGETRSTPSASTSWRMVSPASAFNLTASLGRRFSATKNSVMLSRANVDTGTSPNHSSSRRSRLRHISAVFGSHRPVAWRSAWNAATAAVSIAGARTTVGEGAGTWVADSSSSVNASIRADLWARAASFDAMTSSASCSSAVSTVSFRFCTSACSARSFFSSSMGEAYRAASTSRFAVKRSFNARSSALRRLAVPRLIETSDLPKIARTSGGTAERKHRVPCRLRRRWVP